MLVMPLASIISRLGSLGLLFLLVSCGWAERKTTPRHLQFYQNWQLQTGGQVAGYQITHGLGDVGLDLQGNAIYAPYSGQIQAHTRECVLFSTAQLPAYLFRLCGLHRPRLGAIGAGQRMGAVKQLQFAALRKQPDGTWAFVEPSADLLERILKQPSSGEVR